MFKDNLFKVVSRVILSIAGSVMSKVNLKQAEVEHRIPSLFFWGG